MKRQTRDSLRCVFSLMLFCRDEFEVADLSPTCHLCIRHSLPLALTFNHPRKHAQDKNREVLLLSSLRSDIQSFVPGEDGLTDVVEGVVVDVENCHCSKRVSVREILILIYF